MRTSLAVLAVLLTLAASAQPRTWYVLSREEGCVETKVLVDLGIAERTPASPEDHAQMLRSQGKKVTLELPPQFPAEFKGQLVQVRVSGQDGGVVFATDEVCRRMKDRR